MRIFKYLLVFLLVLLFSTVIVEFDQLKNSWSTSKGIYILYLAAFSYLIIAFKLLSLLKVVIKLNFVDLSILAFVVYVFFRLLFTDHASFLDSEFILLMALLGIYLLFRKILNKDQKNCNFFALIVVGCLMVAGLLQACYGLLQLYELVPTTDSYFKLTGSFGNPDHYAGFLATVIPLATGVYLFYDKKVLPKAVKYLSLCTLLACLLVLPATYIRGAWLAALVGVGFIFIIRYSLIQSVTKFINTITKKVVCGTIGLILIIALGTGLYKLKPDSAYGRLFIWKVTTTSIVAENPFFGIGFDRFKADYNNYQSAHFASGVGNERDKKVAGNVRQAHNEYLQILAELGVIGLILFGGILYSLFKGWNHTFSGQDVRLDTVKKIVAISATASLLSIGTLALFSFPFHILPNALNAIFLLVLCSSLYQYQVQIPIIFEKSKQTIFAIVLIALSLFGFYYTSNKFLQYKEWKKTVDLSFINVEDERTTSRFKRLYPSLKNNGEFLFNYGSYYIRSGKPKAAIPLLEKARMTYAGPNLYLLLGKSYQQTGKFKKAEKKLRHASNMRPHKMYPRYLLAKLFSDTGNTQKALKAAKNVLQMKRKKGTAAAREIKIEMRELLKLHSAVN